MNKKVIVKPHEKLVVAMMEKYPKRVNDECEERCSHTTAEIVREIVFWEDLNHSTNPFFKAVSKCDKEDTFDERVGKEIACSLVDKKYHVAMAKKYSKIKKYLLKAIEEVSVLEDMHNTKADNITADIQRCYIDVDR